MSYCDGEGWSDLRAMARGTYEVMRGMAALVFLPPVPGLHHQLVTPALPQPALGHRQRLLAISVFAQSTETEEEVRRGIFHSLRCEMSEVSKKGEGKKGNGNAPKNQTVIITDWLLIRLICDPPLI